MALTSGTKLGPYEIQSPLGAGGMGEVYRARDARLNRDVAIKILPASFSADPGSPAAFRAGIPRRRRSESSQHSFDLRYWRGFGDMARLTSSPNCSKARRLRDRLRDGAAPFAQSHRLCAADRQRPGRRAREGHRPSRPEAGKHFHHGRRPRKDSRLRPGQVHPPGSRMLPATRPRSKSPPRPAP